MPKSLQIFVSLQSSMSQNWLELRHVIGCLLSLSDVYIEMTYWDV